MRDKSGNYIRFCKRCGRFYRTIARASKFCLNCDKSSHGNTYNKQMLEEINNEY